MTSIVEVLPSGQLLCSTMPGIILLTFSLVGSSLFLEMEKLGFTAVVLSWGLKRDYQHPKVHSPQSSISPLPLAPLTTKTTTFFAQLYRPGHHSMAPVAMKTSAQRCLPRSGKTYSQIRIHSKKCPHQRKVDSLTPSLVYSHEPSPKSS